VRRAKKTPVNSGSKELSAKLRDIILKSLDEDQADDVLAIDLEGKSSIADFMIIASGRNARHVVAIADHILSKLKDEGLGKIKVEGITNGDWVLLDAGDIIIHLFKPEVREFYALERIWLGESKHLASN